MLQWVHAHRSSPPFPVDALVEEEDTYLTLSAEAEIRLPADHPVRVMTDAHAAEEVVPGSLVVRRPKRRGEPLLFLAVVHKLDERPSWREAFIDSALEAVAREAKRRELHSLGLPLLGTVHGKFDARRSLELTREALGRVSGLERIWIFDTNRRNAP